MTDPLAHRIARFERWGAMASLLDADPDLGAGLDERGRQKLRRQLVADVLVLSPGWVEEHAARAVQRWSIILDGVLARRVSVWGRSSVELLGAGDVLLPPPETGAASHPPSTTWRVITRTRLGRLERDLLETAQEFPGVGAVLARRIAQRSEDLAARLAIAQMPRLEDRLVAELWQIADRWGHVVGERVHIPLRLSHGLLAELVCAQRPPITLALGRLIDEAIVSRGPAGTWFLARHAVLPTPPPIVAAMTDEGLDRRPSSAVPVEDG